jgi:hypothetical protein
MKKTILNGVTKPLLSPLNKQIKPAGGRWHIRPGTGNYHDRFIWLYC